jgi:hypothetical protein
VLLDDEITFSSLGSGRPYGQLFQPRRPAEQLLQIGESDEITAAAHAKVDEQFDVAAPAGTGASRFFSEARIAAPSL